MHQAYKLKNKPVILDIDLLSEQIGMGYFETSGFKNNDLDIRGLSGPWEN